MAHQHAPGFLKLVEDAKKHVKETDVHALKKRLDKGEKPLIVDVREDNEWANGHVPGAIHLARGIIERDIEGRIADKEAEILLYCGGGFRSALSAESLQKMGYANVVSVDGGWRGWTSAGYPVEK